MSEKPEQFNMSLLRTLQRRVAQWRMLQIKMYQENHHQQTCYPEDIISKFVSLATHAIT